MAQQESGLTGEMIPTTLARMAYHESWTDPAVSAFEKAIAAHGGWRAWSELKTVDLRLKEFRGVLPFIKGLRRTFFAPQLMTIDPKKRHVEFVYGTHSDFFANGRLVVDPEQKEFEAAMSPSRRRYGAHVPTL